MYQVIRYFFHGEEVVPISEIEHLRAEVATLRALLREATPKCQAQRKDGQMCDDVATWQSDIDEERWHCFCDAHHVLCADGTEPYDLGRRIKTALEETT